MKGIKPGTRAILVEQVVDGPFALMKGIHGVVTDVLADITDDGRDVTAYRFRADNSALMVEIPETAVIPEDAREGLVLMLENGRVVRREIEQIFIDVESWNENSIARKKGAAPIDPDPDGFLRRQANALDRTISDLEQRLGLQPGQAVS